MRTAGPAERRRRTARDPDERDVAQAAWLERWWRAPVAAALAITVAAVIAVGGAHPRTQVLLATAVLLVLVLDGIASRGVRRAPFAGMAFLGLGLSCLQLLPLPSAAVRWLSPHAYELVCDAAGAVPSFMRLSLDAPATVLEVCKGFACTGMLLLVGRCATRERRARFLLVGLSALGVAVALVGFAERAVHTDTILGVYRVKSLPGSFVFGTFVNSNHAASLLELAALVSIGFAFESAGAERAAAAAAAALCAAAVFFTGSRAGAVSLVSAGFVLTLVLVSRRYGARRGLFLATVVAVVTSLAVLVLADGLRGRLLPADPGLLVDNQKTHGWAAAWRLARDYPWTGVGRGAFEAPATAYRASDEGVRLVYPENLPLQIVTEWGLPALGVLLVWFGIMVARVVSRMGRFEPAVVGAACGVLAVLLHDLADFGLEMPGVALPTVVAFAVVAARLPAGRRAAVASPVRAASRKIPLPFVIAGVAVWLAALVAGRWATAHTLTEDGARARAAVTRGSPDAAAVLDAARLRHPADYYLELVAAIHAMSDGGRGVLHHLNRAIRLDPNSGETHAVAARWLARLGHREQAALEFRLAREHGVATDLDQLFPAVGLAAADAVPQEPQLLMSLSQRLSAGGHVAAADIAARRAVERSSRRDGPLVLVNVVDIAVASGDPAAMIRAADYVLAAAPSEPAAIEAAVRALDRAGERSRAIQALDAALVRLPRDVPLLLAAARVRLELGDPAGARTILTRRSDAELHLADLVALQELLARIADQMQDPDGAVIARARARMFARRLAESQP